MCPPCYYQSFNGRMVTHALGHWARDIRLHIAGTNEPKSAQQVRQKVLRSFYIYRI